MTTKAKAKSKPKTLKALRADALTARAAQDAAIEGVHRAMNRELDTGRALVAAEAAVEARLSANRKGA